MSTINDTERPATGSDTSPQAIEPRRHTTESIARVIREQADSNGKTYADVRAAFTDMTDDEFAAVWNGEAPLYLEPAIRFAMTIAGEEHWESVMAAIFDRTASA